MRMATLLLSLFLTACSTVGDDTPVLGPTQGPMRDRARAGEIRRGAGGLLEMLPPAQWWRDVHLVEGVDLTEEQIARLEEIYAGNDEAMRLVRDRRGAMEEIEETLEKERPAPEEITAAARRLREIDDALFERQLRILIDVRQVLSQRQWERLEDNLEEDRRPMRMRQGSGRGGFGGGGRRGGRPPRW